MNEQNLNFYNNLDVEHFKKLSVLGGFDSYIDIKLVYPYIKNAQSILELGAGYGRCIEFYVKNKFKGRIIALEFIPKLVSYLLETYTDKIEIVQQDIKNVQLKEKVDVALWMWSGFIDFSREEQPECIQKIFGLLNKKGKLIIDLPKIGFQTIATHVDKQNIHFESTYGNLDCYIPNEEELRSYAMQSGFKNIIPIHYKTTTDKERTIYILEKE